MTPLNLYATGPGGTPPRWDERFHVQTAEPVPAITYGPFKLWRTVTWRAIYVEDGRDGVFVSTTWPGTGRRRLQYYRGTCKCDGGRTYMLRHRQLGGTEEDQTKYVMTTTPSEMRALRIHQVDDVPVWNNMGGS